MASAPPAPLNIMILGPTGSGKTSVVNMYATEGHGEVGHSLASQTLDAKFWLCRIGAVLCSVADTPGMGDTEGRDQVFLNDLPLAAQRHCDGVHHMLLTLPVCERRFNMYHRTAIEMLVALFGGPTQIPRGTVSLMLTQANSGQEAYWDRGGRKEERRQEWAQEMLELLGQPAQVIYHGEGNDAELVSLVANISRDVYIQTEFMRTVKTQQTLHREATEAAAEANQRSVVLAEEVAQQQQVVTAARDEAQRAARVAQEAKAEQEALRREVAAATTETEKMRAQTRAAEAETKGLEAELVRVTQAAAERQAEERAHALALQLAQAEIEKARAQTQATEAALAAANARNAQSAAQAQTMCRKKKKCSIM